MKTNMFRLLVLALSIGFISCGEKQPVGNGGGNNNGGGGGNEDGFVAEVSAPDIFVKGQQGYHTYRIPALAKTNKGTLLAFCEGRKNGGGDSGDIDMLLRRSIDGGLTWSKMIVVWDDEANTCGNPAPVVDPETGRIHLLMTHNLGVDKAAGDFNIIGKTKGTRTVWYTYSDDDGLTWSKAKDITSEAKEDGYGWYATGPCHGMVKKKAPYKGRIIIPCDKNTMVETSGSVGYSHVIYSDDNGRTWKIGDKVQGGNESAVAELEDGSIIISCRAGGGKRILAWSSDGGETFTGATKVSELPDPRCQASMLDTEYDGQHILIHSNCANASARTRLTLKASLDGGKKWTAGHVVWDGPAAYSDIVMISDRIVGILYENGNSGSYERISFDRAAIPYIIK